jgi:hypothetical protein
VALRCYVSKRTVLCVTALATDRGAEAGGRFIWPVAVNVAAHMRWVWRRMPR